MLWVVRIERDFDTDREQEYDDQRWGAVSEAF